jgi:hypothetical protein
MPGDVPDLIIPIRMDPQGATAALKKVEAAGKQAGDSVKAGADGANKSLQGMGGGAADAASSLLKLTQAQIGLGTLKMVAEKMMSVLSDSADYARRLAADFVQIQKAMQGLAAIAGKPNQNEFVLSEVKKAEAANLTPQEWTEFRSKYMAKTSMYVGDKPGSKLSEMDNEELQSRAAEFAKGKGISAGTMANMIGGMLAQEKGKTTSKEMLSKLGKVYAGLKASSTEPEQLMAGMTELMAAGFTAEDAAASIAQMPEIAPGQEATYLQRTTMELGQQQREGKIGEKQGLREGMNPREKLKQVTKYLQGKMEAGKTPEEKEKILQREVGEMTGEAVAFRTLTGLARQGPQAMEQWEKLVQETPENAVQTTVEADRDTDAGKVRVAEAKAAAGKAETGGKHADVNLMRLQAAAELEKEGRFDHPTMGEMANDWIPSFMGGDATLREQQINARAMRNAKRELGETDNMEGIGMASVNKAVADRTLQNLNKRIEDRDEERRRRAEEGQAGNEGKPAIGREGDTGVANTLKKIEENTAKAADAAARAAAGSEAPKALEAKPPGGNGARQ